MVRGLDYYTRTTFEMLTNALGAQSAVGAGGRYDGLLKQLGGPALPGIGFAMGIERLALLLAERQKSRPAGLVDIFIAALGNAATEKAFVMAHALRGSGLRVLMDYAGRSLKSQMKAAAKLGSRFVLIIGDDELTEGRAVMRDMVSHEQKDIALPDDLAAWSSELTEKISQT